MMSAGPGYRAPQSLSIIGVPGIPMIGEGDDLPGIILKATSAAGETLREGDVVVIAQKIVSKAEGRMVRLASVTASPEAIDLAAKTDKDPRLVELVLRESVAVVAHRPGVLIVEHRTGLVLANAGIDRSNIDPDTADDEQVLLLPENPDRSAEEIRAGLSAGASVRLAVIVNDSLGRAWRNGTIGTAIGAAGLETLMDLNGRPDLRNRPLQATQVGLADELAAAASVVMGQADEARPVAIVRGLAGHLADGSTADLVRPRETDLFR